MHTASLLTISTSMHCGGGGSALPVGSALSGGVSPCQEGRGVGVGGGIPACTEADPHMNRITDACENITLPQLRCGR